jgi:type III secretory pathway component EscV
MKLPSKRYTVSAVACTAIATIFFYTVAGFPFQVALAVSLILWALFDNLAPRRKTR